MESCDSIDTGQEEVEADAPIAFGSSGGVGDEEGGFLAMSWLAMPAPALAAPRPVQLGSLASERRPPRQSGFDGWESRRPPTVAGGAELQDEAFPALQRGLGVPAGRARSAPARGAAPQEEAANNRAASRFQALHAGWEEEERQRRERALARLAELEKRAAGVAEANPSSRRPLGQRSAAGAARGRDHGERGPTAAVPGVSEEPFIALGDRRETAGGVQIRHEVSQCQTAEAILATCEEKLPQFSACGILTALHLLA